MEGRPAQHPLRNPTALVAASVVGASGTMVLRIGKASGLPSAAVRTFRIVWRRDAASLRPGKLFLRTEAAAVPPALFGVLTTAGMVHARKGQASILALQTRKRETYSRSQVSGQSEADLEPQGCALPEGVPPSPQHDGQCRLIHGAVTRRI